MKIEKYLTETQYPKEKFKVAYIIYHFGFGKADKEKYLQKNGKDVIFDTLAQANTAMKKEKADWGDGATFRVRRIKDNKE